MNFAGLPPEINSLRMYSGPGSGSMRAAAAAWDGLAAELHSTATAYQSVISRLAGESWLGPSSQAMAGAFAPYVSWLAATAVRAGNTATQVKAAATGYEAAFAMTVPPSVVAANRARLLILVATNVLGQNTAAIGVAEAQYAEMWAQDAAAMYGYAISSAQAAELAPFAPPPAGPSEQAAAASGNLGSVAASGNLGSVAAQAATAAPAPPAQGLALFDLVGLDAIAGTGLAGTYAGVALSGGAWTSADESTRQILNEQGQLEGVQYEILHAVDLFSPLTPSRPSGYVPTPLPSTSAALGEAVSVGRLSVPMSWAANAPEIRSLSYTAPTVGAAAASAAAAPAASTGAGTAFSQMALAGMGGSALAGTVKGGGQEAVETPTPKEQAKPPQQPPDQPVTGIAAEIREFAELRDRGLISADEYNEQRQRLLGR